MLRVEFVEVSKTMSIQFAKYNSQDLFKSRPTVFKKRRAVLNTMCVKDKTE